MKLVSKSKKVEPIRSIKDIKTLKDLLYKNPRNYALFVVGINTALRASELLGLTCEQVMGLSPGDDIEIIEPKSGIRRKHRRITLNEACIEAINRLLASRDYSPEDYLFYSQRAEVLTVSSLHRLVKSWCKAIHLKGNYGSHTLRKTWGYQQRVHFNSQLPELTEAFGHSSQSQTLAYLCIQPEEIKSLYNNVL